MKECYIMAEHNVNPSRVNFTPHPCVGGNLSPSIPAFAGMTRKRGFSLVELSIVLVILGLLVGGVLSGQSLIRASELRAVTAEFQRYQAATQSFRDKYFALPGDMPNAVRFWGAQAGGTADGLDATCAALTTGATSTATCNGDGNGVLNIATYERTRFWQHLANAGLIEGTYSGILGAPTLLTGGVNVPRSKISNGIWAAHHYIDFGAGSYSTIGANLTLAIGGSTTASISQMQPLIKPEEAWNIDTKLDDGRPAFGNVATANSSVAPTAGCITSDTPSAASYNLASTATACNLMFLY